MESEKIRQLRRRIDTEDPIFPGWKRLKLGGKDLQHLPVEIFSLAEIEILSLSPERHSCLHFQLTELPDELGRLVNLRVLMLDTNELDQLPDQFGSLTRLEVICLSNNYLSSLPSSFGKLKALKSLHLANNRLETFPKMIPNLKCLEFLDMSDNKLTSLPKDISKLFNLHTLILFLNNLKSLPDTICGMTTLRCLWVGNNNITKLPTRFGQLRNLDWGATGRYMLSSVVDGNPLKEPPMDVCKQGLAAIAYYFGDKLEEEGEVADSQYTSRSSSIEPSRETSASNASASVQPRFKSRAKYGGRTVRK